MEEEAEKTSRRKTGEKQKRVETKEEEAEASPPVKKRAAEEANGTPEKSAIEGERPLSEFPISKETRKVLRAIGVSSLFRVQAETFAPIMEGKDVVVQARTGTGKTLAYTIPMVEKLTQRSDALTRGRGPAAAVFCPTRELAMQVCDVIKSISRSYSVCSLYGGVAYARQETALHQGVDIIVATPGRAKDFLEKGTLHFDRVSFVVIDEADHMLDIGFKDDMELLLNAVANQNGSAKHGKNSHQITLFSATIPDWVQDSRCLGKDRVLIDMIGKQDIKTSQTILFYRRKCLRSEIPRMLGDLIRVYSGKHGRTLVFTNTKKDCHDLSINNEIKLDCQCLHGDMQQDQRESTMKSFRTNKFAVLIATDVAARGLDLPMVDLVIQAAPPSDIDAFIHRAGRTGRAGRKGVCVLLYSEREACVVERIEGHAKIKFQTLPPPTQQEILQAVARDVTEDIARVERRATELFRPQAEAILKEADPVEILASALAVMSGYTQTVSKRGLITGAENSTTIKMDSYNPLPIGAYCSILRTNLGDEILCRCREITLLKDAPGCVFDVPDSLVSDILAVHIRGMTLQVINEMPPVIPRTDAPPRSRSAPQRYSPGSPTARGGRFAQQRWGQFGGRGGGVGRGSGGRGGVGRGRSGSFQSAPFSTQKK